MAYLQINGWDGARMHAKNVSFEMFTEHWEINADQANDGMM